MDARLTIFEKVLIANSVIIAGGAVLGTWLTVNFAARFAVGLAVSFFITGVTITLVVNYVLLKFAFHPLFELRSTMEQVQAGNFAARTRSELGDPDIRLLARTFNDTLDRLDSYRRSVSAQILRAQEEERKRIARELHDETSQALTSLMIALEVATDRLPEGADQATEQLRRAKGIVARTLEEVKRVTVELRPTVLDDLGLAPAIRWYVKHYVEPAGLAVSLDIQGLEGRLEAELETAVFRVVQEALTNALRHAHASRVGVELLAENGTLRATIRDDGRGFDPARATGDGDRGLGLVGMRERASLVGGELAITSSPGAGTQVELVAPLNRGSGRAAG